MIVNKLSFSKFSYAHFPVWHNIQQITRCFYDNAKRICKLFSKTIIIDVC